MTVDTIDGVRVLKLHDGGSRVKTAADDMMAMVHFWRLLSGGHELRDATAAPRRFL